jgi:hypothetical protein
MQWLSSIAYGNISLSSFDMRKISKSFEQPLLGHHIDGLHDLFEHGIFFVLMPKPKAIHLQTRLQYWLHILEDPQHPQQSTAKNHLNRANQLLEDLSSEFLFMVGRGMDVQVAYDSAFTRLAFL